LIAVHAASVLRLGGATAKVPVPFWIPTKPLPLFQDAQAVLFWILTPITFVLSYKTIWKEERGVAQENNVTPLQ
jgi:hypothetical protein